MGATFRMAPEYFLGHPGAWSDLSVLGPPAPATSLWLGFTWDPGPQDCYLPASPHQMGRNNWPPGWTGAGSVSAGWPRPPLGHAGPCRELQVSSPHRWKACPGETRPNGIWLANGAWLSGQFLLHFQARLFLCR